jgi:hypothetical protein
MKRKALYVSPEMHLYLKCTAVANRFTMEQFIAALLAKGLDHFDSDWERKFETWKERKDDDKPLLV